jgi:hypothetical protein
LLVVLAVLGSGMISAAAAVGSHPTGPEAADPEAASSLPKDFVHLTALAHTQPGRGVAWSPDASKFAVGDDLGNVMVYDSSSALAVKTFQAHTSSIRAVSWSKDSALLATASRDKTIKLWATDKWTEVKKVEAFDDDVLDVVWTPRVGGAQEFVAASASGQIKRFDATGKALNNLTVDTPGSARPTALAWDPQGDLVTGIVLDIFTFKTTVYTWIASSGNKQNTVQFADVAHDIKWGPTGLIAVGLDKGVVRFLTATTLVEKHNVSAGGGKALTVAWGPKGVGGAMTSLLVGGDDGGVRVIDADMGAMQANLSRAHSISVLALEVSPNGTKAVSSAQDGTVIAWGDAAPRVVWSKPAKSGERNASVDITPVLKFDRPMDDATLKTAVTISAIGAVSVVIDADSNNTVAEIVPATKLENDKEYTLTIDAGARSHPDLGGVAMGADHLISFKTVAAVTPGLNIPWLYVGAGIGGLFLMILIVLLLRRRRGGPRAPREVRVGKRGSVGKGDDWES